MARYLYILASDIPLENVLNHLLLCLNHSYKIRHTELTSNVPSTNVVVWLKLPAIQFLLMTASLSLGSTSSRHTHTHTLSTAPYFYLYYMLTLHPLPPFPSATLYWQKRKTQLPLLVHIVFLSLPTSRAGDSCCNSDIDVLIVKIRSWIRIFIVQTQCWL